MANKNKKRRTNFRNYWLKQALISIEHEDYTNATKCFTEILGKDPDDIEVLECLKDIFIIKSDKKMINKYIKEIFASIPVFFG